jgi:hypothetical protein
MIYNNQPYFIDYQGGRKGPLQYDVASLLFQVKANLPFEQRKSLLDYYLKQLERRISVDTEEFYELYIGFVLVRLLQVLGAYGFRGLHEKKDYFIDSLKRAMKNVSWYLYESRFSIDLPEVNRTLQAALDKYQPLIVQGEKQHPLTVRVASFSYKKGLPKDNTENGGGHYFDCRALPNPGREEKYRAFTGKDEIVINFLEKEPEVHHFLDHSKSIVDISVKNYIVRDFTNLMVSFGCTGGQHRSVYCAEKLAAYLQEKYNINVELTHKELS